MTNEQIEALKREVKEHRMDDGKDISPRDKYDQYYLDGIDNCISYLLSQNRLLADGCVGVPEEVVKRINQMASMWTSDEYIYRKSEEGDFESLLSMKETFIDAYNMFVRDSQKLKTMIAAQTEKREGE